MKSATKKWLIAAAALLTVGALIFVAVMSVYRWDFSKLGTEKYETNTYEITQPFSNISIRTDTADICFAAAEDGQCKAVCRETKKVRHSVSVEGDTLTVQSADARKWYEHIGIDTGSVLVTVFLQEQVYESLTVKESTGDIEIAKELNFKNVDLSVSTGAVDLLADVAGTAKIKTSTGDICVKNITAGTLDLTVSTGEITLENVQCGKLQSKGSTGDLLLKNVNAAGKITLERSTGNIKFDRSDAAEISVQTSTGNVTGTLASEKVFDTKTNTGTRKVPKTASGGICKVRTSTGNIILTVA